MKKFNIYSSRKKYCYNNINLNINMQVIDVKNTWAASCIILTKSRSRITEIITF